MKVKQFLFLGPFFLLLMSGLVLAQTTTEVKLKDYKRIDKPARDEVSGIIKDKRFEDVIWIHGDSGTENKVYPINSKGEVLPNKKSNGLEILGVENKDWEDIAMDEKGNLYVADVGNNCSCRKDQSIIVLNNPQIEAGESNDYEVYKVSYEKPDGFIYRFLNYSMDVEAMFLKNDKIFILTKRFRGKNTKLFMLDALVKDQNNEFKLVESFDFDDEVTGSDYAFGKLAVLTYKSLWIFKDNDTDDFFDGDVNKYTFDGEQIESVTFLNSDTILIAEENGELYKIAL